MYIYATVYIESIALFNGYLYKYIQYNAIKQLFIYTLPIYRNREKREVKDSGWILYFCDL